MLWLKEKKNLQFGKWYVGRTEFNLNGILKLNYNNNEGELELYSDEFIPLPYNTDVVYGKTYQGESITLYKCSIQGSKSTVSPYSNNAYKYITLPGTIHVSIKGGAFFLCRKRN
ncbi:hypothetical protein [Alkalihalobacillus sp. LMS39]|uniref:ApeA N-terminal domain 1-containing protein n=1 Tax=Alkalihalobacillus sp. LMS39 TaxID=2924032 RepID=UPI001FB2FFB7|nr:hypothetical protein [Alkalihalobacillus sp. LMS39]UOE95077.1 hypothetical protein MM271_05440 [Alkalihalobacillus sp. LMS39]